MIMDNGHSNKPTAFIIGPIGDRDAERDSPARLAYEDGIETLENIIFPACKSLGIEAFRADHIARTGEIPEQVFRSLRDCAIVIADVTDANPNVMYELGLRHTTDKLTIQIGERGRLPFDISAIRTILFKRTEVGMIEATRALVRALAIGVDSGGDRVAATRIWHEKMLPASIPVVVDDDEGDDEVGFLEHLSEMEENIHLIGEDLAAASSAMDEMTRIFSDGVERINRISASARYSANKLSIADNIAAQLMLPASRLTQISEDYAKHVERAEPGMLYLLNSMIASPEQLKEAPEFPAAIRALVEGAAASMVHAAEFDRSVTETGRATRSMKRVALSISKGINRMIGTSGTINGWHIYLDRLPES